MKRPRRVGAAEAKSIGNQVGQQEPKAYAIQNGLVASRLASARDRPMSRNSWSPKFRSSFRELARSSHTVKPCPRWANTRCVFGISVLMGHSRNLPTGMLELYDRNKPGDVISDTKFHFGRRADVRAGRATLLGNGRAALNVNASSGLLPRPDRSVLSASPPKAEMKADAERIR
jgi:hypothetical protein